MLLDHPDIIGRKKNNQMYFFNHFFTTIYPFYSNFKITFTLIIDQTEEEMVMIPFREKAAFSLRAAATSWRELRGPNENGARSVVWDSASAVAKVVSVMSAGLDPGVPGGCRFVESRAQSGESGARARIGRDGGNPPIISIFPGYFRAHRGMLQLKRLMRE